MIDPHDTILERAGLRPERHEPIDTAHPVWRALLAALSAIVDATDADPILDPAGNEQTRRREVAYEAIDRLREALGA